MIKSNNLPLYILLSILALLFLSSLLECNSQPPHQLTTERSVQHSVDSTLTFIDRTAPSLSVKSRLTPLNRKLSLDTIVNGDTLLVEVARDSSIAIRLRPAPRIVAEWVRYLRRDSVIREREIVTELIHRPWYESPLLVLAGAVLGFLIAILL